MRLPAGRLVFGSLAICLVTLLGGVAASAVSRSDVAYYDGFQDVTGLDATRSKNVTLDTLGGIRLVTNGAAQAAKWSSAADFTSPAPPLGPVIGFPTLDAASTPGSLTLHSSPLAFRRTQPGPILRPSAPLSPDGFGVGGMCVQRVENTYYLWYTGVPENEYSQSIYLATSADGLVWIKEPDPVLGKGEAGSFDSRQLGKPTVIYDPSNTAAPFRMWYAGEGDLGGSVGYATSMDGRVWTKAGEVFGPGKIGMADSYRVTHPCVLMDEGVYYMWYTADDSNNRRVAYATSTDGVTWERGGVVFDVGTGNFSEAAFAPAVVKLGTETPDDPRDDGFHMVFTGNKIVAGGDIQSKLINASSADGLTWAAGNIAFSAAGGDTAFDGYNVSQPAILHDPADAAHPYKMWYVGNNPDSNGNFHDRIGLAQQKQSSSVTQWEKVAGPAGDPYYGAHLTLGAQGAAFDSMMVADLRTVAKPASAGPGLYGFYTGTNAADFAQRIGVRATQDDGATWTEVNDGSALIGTGPADAFDAGGVACPAPVVNPAGGWWLLHTSFDAAGGSRIGLHTVSDDLQTVNRSATPALAPAGGFDAGGQADPCAVSDGDSLVVFYTGEDSAGVSSIGVGGSAVGDAAALVGSRQILAPTPGGYDDGGLRKPVARKLADGSWRLFYAAIGPDDVKRIAFATSSDGTTWVKQGLVMTPATAAYDFAEAGLEPASCDPIGSSGESLTFTGTDRFGWTRIGKAAASEPGYLDSGVATYELANPTARDWRRILWAPATAPAGADAQVWVSYYPTYSGDWSNPFPITNNTDLPFLLTVQSMRWQLRMTSTGAAVSPRLDDLTVSHAPVQFPTTGKIVTLPIGPPDGLYLLTWGDLTLTCDQPGGTAVTVEVEDDAGAQVIAPQVVTAGSMTLPLAGVAPIGGRLVAVCTLSGDGSATPKIKNLTATYTTTTTPATMTLAASRTLLTYGQTATLKGKLVSDPTPLVPDDGNAAPLAGQTVSIKKHRAGTVGYTDAGTAVTGADGSFSLSVKPTVITTYRAEWAGGSIDAVVYPPASAGARIQVKPKIALGVTRYNSRSGKYYRYRLGRTVYVRGTVSPKHAKLGDGVTAGKVTVTVYKYRSATRKWVKFKSSTRRLTTRSKYTWSWRRASRGSYRLRTTFAGDVDHAKGTSSYRYVKVF